MAMIPKFNNKMIKVLKYNRIRRHGFTLLELATALVLTAIIMTSIVALINNTQSQIKIMDRYISQRGSLNVSVDMIMDDIVYGARTENDLQIEEASYQNLETTHLTITHERKGKTKKQPLSQIEWVAVPRDDQSDLVLFRRDLNITNMNKALFYPQADNIYLFDAYMMDPFGDVIDDPNERSALLGVTVQAYREGERDIDRIITVRRTFSLNRFRE